MNLESPKISLQKSTEEIFTLLSEVKNFQQLMPEEINKFEIIDADIFVFALKGMPEIKLKIKEKEPFSKLILGAVSSKLSFTLTISLFSTSVNSSDVKLDFTGDFNPMMAMMIKGPLQKFIDTLAKNMPKL